jgi:hypothetical protein
MMNAPKIINKVVVTALVLALAINFTHQYCFVAAKKERILYEFTTWHVYVVNGLSNNRELSVHCKSKDDDLGFHCLSAGDNFTWSFREDFFLRTLFWCDVNKDDAHAVFKVFWHDVLLFYKCMWKNCVWTVKDDGIYIKNLDHDGLDELYRNWKPAGQ